MRNRAPARPREEVSADRKSPRPPTRNWTNHKRRSSDDENAIRVAGVFRNYYDFWGCGIGSSGKIGFINYGFISPKSPLVLLEVFLEPFMDLVLGLYFLSIWWI